MNKWFSRRHIMRPSQYATGLSVLLLLVCVYGGALQAVFNTGEPYPWRHLWQDDYLHRVLLFSFGQASLSAFLSVFIGAIFARAFFYQSFKGKDFLLKIFSLTFVLPSLVAIFGLLGIYGSSGWAVKLLQAVHIQWRPDIYGLSGILIAHLFFNIPLAVRMFLQGLHNIPNQQRQLAAQLNLRGWQFIRLIELPYLRQQLLPVFMLIFTLCFTSFAIVLTLGGGPKYTTLEVAIYQAIIFDFDLAKAALFALLQFVFCFTLFGLSALFSSAPETNLSYKELWIAKQSSAVKIWQILVLILVGLFILLPLVNIVAAAFSAEDFISAWQDPQLWRAMGFSFTIAPLSACLSLLMSMGLLLLSRRLVWLHLTKIANVIMNLGMLILAVPGLILAVGLFLLLQKMEFGTAHLFAVMVMCNAFSAMPFVIRILAPAMNNNMQYYEKLCQSLGIRGWQRFRLIEQHKLVQPIKYAFALACTLSLGDFTAIALFGSQQFSSLPYLLYQQLGSYRGDQAAVTALVLLLMCLLIFILVEGAKNSDKNENANDKT
ncbi:thiamine/thiamine pyrophosphate ABC transporter permease ThiP [Basfia succiniciproducens]|uniref:thiamine/thiamine pyrophosphate ABC transporter permease ThiP n=1 Tax=Basfia succiniciproducens TaxID=653940 RepID=UPI000AA579B7|nr:thiamine/thiamine pyrophosphate ABC transporter permease ThiP [Basfia succiniciproducens]